MAAILVRKRAELVALESFASTAGYARLLESVQELVSGDVEPWLADWLMHPSMAFGAVPLVLADQPGGVQLLIDQLHRAVSGAGYASGQLTLNHPSTTASMVPTKPVRWTPCQTPSRPVAGDTMQT